jgi:uncharacterized membrane protein
MRIPFVTGLTARLVDHWIRVQSSYWFIPSVMTLGAVALSGATVAVDRAAPEWVGELNWIAANQPEGARALLAAVAGSMITVAGVTFSMTLLMVSFASTQLGPRLVPRFLRDRGNQVVLGTFIATFIYCLLVLRTVRSVAEARAEAPDAVPFVPHFSLLVGVLLALLSVAVLIYFVHHVPSRINASSVIGLLGDELKRQLEHEFPPADERGAALAWPVDPVDEGDVIRLDESGSYLRVVDYDGLVALAQRSDRRFETLVVPGAFSVPGAPIARVYGGPLDDACLRELRAMFSWGADRTAHQDLLFVVDQLAEIAGKALSTGVNDQLTALLCIDQMERVLCAATRRREPDAVRGADGTGRVLARHVSLPDVADRFLVPLREFSRGDLITTDRLLAMIERCMSLCAAESPLQRALSRHRDAILEDAESALPAASQKKWLAVRRAERNAPRAADPSAQSSAGS